MLSAVGETTCSAASVEVPAEDDRRAEIVVHHVASTATAHCVDRLAAHGRRRRSSVPYPGRLPVTSAHRRQVDGAQAAIIRTDPVLAPASSEPGVTGASSRARRARRPAGPWTQPKAGKGPAHAGLTARAVPVVARQDCLTHGLDHRGGCRSRRARRTVAHARAPVEITSSGIRRRHRRRRACRLTLVAHRPRPARVLRSTHPGDGVRPRAALRCSASRLQHGPPTNSISNAVHHVANSPRRFGQRRRNLPRRATHRNTPCQSNRA